MKLIRKFPGSWAKEREAGVKCSANEERFSQPMRISGATRLGKCSSAFTPITTGEKWAALGKNITL